MTTKTNKTKKSTYVYVNHHNVMYRVKRSDMIASMKAQQARGETAVVMPESAVAFSTTMHTGHIASEEDMAFAVNFITTHAA